MFNGSLHDETFVGAAIDRLRKLYVEKDEALVAASTFKCTTHEILLGMLTAVKVAVGRDV